MKVKMRIAITGTRDGVDWPAAGETIDVPAEEAASLVHAELAEAVIEQAAVSAPERAVARRQRKG